MKLFTLPQNVNPGHRPDSLDSLVSSSLRGSRSFASDETYITTVIPQECQWLDFKSAVLIDFSCNWQVAFVFSAFLRKQVFKKIEEWNVGFCQVVVDIFGMRPLTVDNAAQNFQVFEFFYQMLRGQSGRWIKWVLPDGITYGVVPKKKLRLLELLFGFFGRVRAVLCSVDLDTDYLNY